MIAVDENLKTKNLKNKKEEEMKLWKFALAALIPTAIVFIALVVQAHKIGGINMVWVVISVFVINVCILAIVYSSGQTHAIPELKIGEEGVVIGFYAQPNTSGEAKVQLPVLIRKGCVEGSLSLNLAILLYKTCSDVYYDLRPGDKVRHNKVFNKARVEKI